ncbi:class I adenylate-forming enzyme family protein [Burkholderia cenocepacia]|uniref:class I adenylate-forming enzyme family protein n=1 Tax=Burkholderia cenocepacia TaxID=95486 RepID=UPI002ABDF1C1|nr:class I adenylate-forming enzyme family protein [Burkholderia cenocepacia]
MATPHNSTPQLTYDQEQPYDDWNTGIDCPPLVLRTDDTQVIVDGFEVHNPRPRDTALSSIESVPELNSLAELLDYATSHNGDKPLLNFFDQGVRFTTSQFDEATRRLAALLQSRGVGLGTVVALVAANVPMFPVSWFALLRLGAVMVPVNPRYTEDEMHFIINDAHASFVLADTEYQKLIESATSDVIRRDRLIYFERGIVRNIVTEFGILDLPRADALRPVPVGLDDPAGIHYTSGTTGFPKGCVLTHRSWLASGAAKDSFMPYRPRRILTDTPFFYIDAPSELVLALGSGAEQYVASRTSLSKFVSWLVEFDIDYVEVWDALGERIVDPASEERLRARNRVLYATTFGMRAEHHRDLERRLNAKIRECFGMTEVGLATAQSFLSDREVGTGSCGVVTPHRETRIVDVDTGLDVAPNEVGELWVRGPGIMLRYHNRPDANQESFRPCGWFRTGDLVRRDKYGSHFVMGRIKDMIRRSAENVAANEVESVISQIKGVAEVAVVGVPDSFRGEEVKAFVVLEDDIDTKILTPKLLRSTAAKSLAPFKVPRYWEFVKDLPLTPSGKIKKVSLKQMDASGPYGWDAECEKWSFR